MGKLTLQSLNQLPSLWDAAELRRLLSRAEKAFEKKSGWKSSQVKATIDSFSRLNGANKALFGGLLLGNALVPTRRTKGARSSRKGKTAGARA